MSDVFGKQENKKEIIKKMIKRLHKGEDPEKVKEEFKDSIKGLTPIEIGQIEQELIQEGMPREEVHKLCDVHLALFRENVEKARPEVPTWHPVFILMEEHKFMLDYADKLRNVINEIKGVEDIGAADEQIETLNHIAEHFKESESHYLREENVLFSVLEKHGITQPPAMMWIDHDKIRELKKGLYKLIDSEKNTGFAEKLDDTALALSEMLSSHFYKENNVLFPMGLKTITDSEWINIRKEFDEMGYCCFTPKPTEVAGETVIEKENQKDIGEGVIHFETGTITFEEIGAMLNSLPVDVTFVDKDDTVRYFNKSEERIFVRTKAVIGRKVQQCHPQKSVYVVNQILEDFKNEKRDSASFWINFQDKLVYIRYFPVRNKNGDYLGCIEVTQDIKLIKEIEGEKRLLDY